MSNSFMTDRRGAIKGLLAISAAGALAACKASETGTSKASSVSVASKLSVANMALLSSLAQTIIPKTDTAGAIEAGVPDVLQVLYTEFADDNHRRYWSAGLENLNQHFLKTGGQTFSKMTASQQANLLGKYDAKAYAEAEFDDFYKNMKSTISKAYYMSEPGASEELAYEPVPGEFKGCVPLSDYPKTWAT